MEQRLQKVIADAGIASRRKAEELIVAGRVRVDGRVIRELGTKIDPENSEVERLHASIEKAKALLGWQPELKGLAGFETGLKKTIEWFLNPKNLSRYKADRYNL